MNSHVPRPVRISEKSILRNLMVFSVLRQRTIPSDKGLYHEGSWQQYDRTMCNWKSDRYKYYLSGCGCDIGIGADAARGSG